MNILLQCDLFARDIQTNIKHWSITVKEDEEQFGIIEIKHGDVNKKMTPKTIVVQTGKNLGRKNETTPAQQAVLDAKGRILKKKREGYKSCKDIGLEFNDVLRLDGSINIDTLNTTLPLTNTDMEGVEKPMKAQKYFKDDGVTPRITFPCFGQPKINGFRAVAYFRKGADDLFGNTTDVILKSKNGLEYNDLTEIQNEFKLFRSTAILNGNLVNILEKYQLKIDDIVFDGEVYFPNTLLEDISSATRKRNELTPSLEFHVFDLAIPKLNQTERLTLLKQIFNIVGSSVSLYKLKKVITKVINSNSEAISYSKQWISEGYEGGIFRDPKVEYAFGKRPMTMVKYKERESKEFIILDIYDTPSNPEVPVFLCQNDINDETFEVVIEGSLEKRKEYLVNKDKHINKKLTVEFYERTKKEVPFHAIGIAVRDYE